MPKSKNHKNGKLRHAPQIPDAAVSLHRQQHDLIEVSVQQIADVAGDIGSPYRRVDVLETLRRNGTITDTMRDAGSQFRNDFDTAHLNTLKATDWARPLVDCGGGKNGSRGGNQGAQDRVWAALQTAGGIVSAPGQCLWHVVGQGDSLTEWSMLTGRHKLQSSGILIAALAALVQHYGSGRSKNSA